jgi:branched-chain amino acid transport system substrate-binding protein
MSKKLTAFVAIAAGSLALTAVVSNASAATPTLIISSDLPLQGPTKNLSDSTNNAIKLYLKQVGYEVDPGYWTAS